MKEAAVRKLAACMAGGTPALHFLFRAKHEERGRPARFVGLIGSHLEFDTIVGKNYRMTRSVSHPVIPAQAGIQYFAPFLDSKPARE
jgi:hypothetical protein